MSTTERIRIEMTFDAGQIVGALVSPQAIGDLQRAPGSADRDTLALEAEDGRYTVALRRVLYVKRFARESRVGFGAT